MVIKPQKNKTIVQDIIITLSIAVLAKIFSYISEVLIAYRVGTSSVGDAYYTITSLHTILYPMISVGIWRVFLPTIRGYISTGDEAKAKKTADWFIMFSAVIVVILIILGLIFMPELISFVVLGFDTETKGLAVLLVRISLPAYFFTILTACLSAVLQSYGLMFASQIRRVVSYFPTIIYAIFLYSLYGVYGLAVAYVADAIVRFAITFFYSIKVYKFSFVVRKPNLEEKKMLRLLPSALASAGCSELQALVDKIMGSTLAVGTISGLNYGRKLFNVFNGLLADSIATAMFPRFISMAKNNELDKFRNIILKTTALILYLTIPISIICFFYRGGIVSFVFERGAFDKSSVAITEGAFGYYILGLPFAGVNTIMLNVLYSYKDTRVAMFITIISTAVNTFMNFMLISNFEIKGLAIATSLAAIISYILTLIYVEKKIKKLWKTQILFIIKLLTISIVSMICSLLISHIVDMSVMTSLTCGVVVFFAIYLILNQITHTYEIKDMINMFRKEVLFNGKKGKNK